MKVKHDDRLEIQPTIDAPLKDWALWHFNNGETLDAYWLTPIRPGEKRPYLKDWSKKPFKTREEVERHWGNSPSDNIGLVPRPGYFWLDADNLEVLQRAEDLYGAIPNTFAQRSLNGNWHFLFKGGVSNSPVIRVEVDDVRQKLGEIRGAGSGQCVGAGSRGTTKRGEPGHWKVEDLSPPCSPPNWVFEAIGGKGTSTLKDARLEYGEIIAWDKTQAEHLVEIVDRGELIKTYFGPLLEGERDNLTYQLFAEAKNRMIHPHAILEQVLASGIHGGLDESVVEQKMESAYADGNTQGGYGSKVRTFTVLNMFKPFSDGRSVDRPPLDPVEWKAANPDSLPNRFPGDPVVVTLPANDDQALNTYAELVAHFKQELAGSQKHERRAVRFGSIKEIPTVSWLIDGWLPRDGVALLYGESESFKTYLALHMLLCIATGTPFAARDGNSGYGVGEPQEVIIFAGESSSGVHQRIEAAIKGNGFDRNQLEQNLIIVDDVYSVNSADGLAAMADEIEGLSSKPAVIVVDTFNLALDGVEDSADDIKKAIKGLRSLARMYSATGLLIDHVGHGPKDRPRGSSAKKANVDVMIYCERNGETRRVTLQQKKNRDADRTKHRVAFEGEPIQIGPGLTNLKFIAVEPQIGSAPSKNTFDQAEQDRQAQHILAALQSRPGHTWSLRELASKACELGCSISKDKLRKDVLKNHRGKRGWPLDHPQLSIYWDEDQQKWATPAARP